MSYNIIRFYAQEQQDGVIKRIVATDLTLDEAKAHCRDRESSSRTATSADAKRQTRLHGPWFDGYEEVP